jgi:hypothetical protein
MDVIRNIMNGPLKRYQLKNQEGLQVELSPDIAPLSFLASAVEDGGLHIIQGREL